MLPQGAGWNLGSGEPERTPEEPAFSGGVEEGLEEARAGPTLFGFSGSDLRSLGLVLVILGVVILLGGIAYMSAAPPMPALTGNFQQDQQAQQTWTQETSAHMFSGLVILMVGSVLLGLGGYALRFGLIQPVATFVAGEASPAIEAASMAVGRGLAEARPDPASSGPVTVVKLKCHACGHLNSEDAEYCEKCGKAL